MKKEHMSPFNLLVGVALSGQPTDNCGNIAVWPRSHRSCHAAAAAARAARADGPTGTDATGTQMDEKDPWAGQRPILGEGVKQLHLAPGDVILVHQKLAHRVSPNWSPHVRYQVYFRLSNVLHEPQATLGTLWDGFDLSQIGEATDVTDDHVQH